MGKMRWRWLELGTESWFWKLRLFDTFLLRYLKQVVSKHQFSFSYFLILLIGRRRRRRSGWTGGAVRGRHHRRFGHSATAVRRLSGCWFGLLVSCRHAGHSVVHRSRWSVGSRHLLSRCRCRRRATVRWRHGPSRSCSRSSVTLCKSKYISLALVNVSTSRWFVCWRLFTICCCWPLPLLLLLPPCEGARCCIGAYERKTVVVCLKNNFSMEEMKCWTHRWLAVRWLPATTVRLLATVGLLRLHSASSSFATMTSISASSSAEQDRHQQELIAIGIRAAQYNGNYIF